MIALFFVSLVGFLVVKTVKAADEVESFDVTGIGSNYYCTAGWCDGTPTVALPYELGGRYTGEVTGLVEVCSTRCAVLPIVDYCECYWGTDRARVVDLSQAAWRLVTDEPLSTGLIPVRVSSFIADGGIPPRRVGLRCKLAAQLPSISEQLIQLQKVRYA